MVEYGTERAGGDRCAAEERPGAAGEGAGGRGSTQRRAGHLGAGAPADRQAAPAARQPATRGRGQAGRCTDRDHPRRQKDRRQTRTASASRRYSL